MAEKEPRLVPAKPLKDFIGEARGAKKAAATALGLREQATLTNWFARGVPLHQLPVVLAFMGISRVEYYRRAGLAAPPRPPDFLIIPHVTESQMLDSIRDLWSTVPPLVKRVLYVVCQDATREARDGATAELQRVWRGRDRRVAQVGVPGQGPYVRRSTDRQKEQESD